MPGPQTTIADESTAEPGAEGEAGPGRSTAHNADIDANQPVSLKSLAMRGAAWTFSSYAAKQVLRVTSNLILTRLLFPEHFGLMALVHVVLTGLEMFSDAGLNQGVVQHRRGADDDFVDTAWTIQVVRGCLLWATCAAAAWPVSLLYNQPMLMWLIPVAGLSSVVAGFRSRSGFTLARKVLIGQMVWRNLVAYSTSLVVMILLAVWFKSVWVLVFGSLLSILLDTLLSYTLPNCRIRFHWDRRAAHELYRFGRWILLSTAVTFLLQQGDRAVLGKLIAVDVLGVYGIAVLWSRAPIEALLRLNAMVLFPVYARLANENRARLRRRLAHARLVLLAAFLPITCGLAIGGGHLVNLLYDSRFADAGWMLRILAVGATATVINATAAGVILAVGDSFRHMINQIVRGTLMILGLYFGWQSGGLPGLLIGMTIVKVVEYPILAWAVAKHGLWLPALDLGAMAACAVVIALGMMLVP